MTIVDRGHGTPVAVIPGIQGRWEFMDSTVAALSARHRVIIYSLIGEPGTGPPIGRQPTLDELVDQLERVLDDRGIERAAICGISFGGVVALRFAARRPARTAALILASVPGPGWHLREAHRAFVRFPRLAAPLFLAGAPSRLRREIAVALPDVTERRAFVRRLISRLIRTPVSPVRMAARARLIDGIDNLSDCALVTAPTLIVTGEPTLDHVVPVNGTSVYSNMIRDARSVTLDSTGHLGCVTRPVAFAEAVSTFLQQAGITSSGEHAA